MPRTAAVLPEGLRISDILSMGVLTAKVPKEAVVDVLEETGRKSKRIRQLPAHVVVYYVIALALYMNVAYEEVLRCLVEGLERLGEPVVRLRNTGRSAISQARSRLGSEPMELLFRRIATVDTSVDVGAVDEVEDARSVLGRAEAVGVHAARNDLHARQLHRREVLVDEAPRELGQDQYPLARLQQTLLEPPLPVLEHGLDRPHPHPPDGRALGPRGGRLARGDPRGARPGARSREVVHRGRRHGDEAATLERLPAHRAFWFGWYAQFPKTELVK